MPLYLARTDCQFVTTVKGAGALAPSFKKLRNRLPSAVTSTCDRQRQREQPSRDAGGERLVGPDVYCRHGQARVRVEKLHPVASPTRISGAAFRHQPLPARRRLRNPVGIEGSHVHVCIARFGPDIGDPPPVGRQRCQEFGKRGSKVRNWLRRACRTIGNGQDPDVSPGFRVGAQRRTAIVRPWTSWSDACPARSAGSIAPRRCRRHSSSRGPGARR